MRSTKLLADVTKVHSFYNLQECTSSSDVQLAVLDVVLICAEGAQHDGGDNDCDICGVWVVTGKRVRLSFPLRISQDVVVKDIAQKGMFCWVFFAELHSS